MYSNVKNKVFKWKGRRWVSDGFQDRIIFNDDIVLAKMELRPNVAETSLNYDEDHLIDKYVL